VVGSGGMGTVYKIEHQISKRIEAMKILPGGLSTDPEQVQRFEREIQVQARLHHPNIAALYTAARDGSSIALVMEYVEGESLQRMLEAGPLPIPTALDFIVQVLSALAYAHSCGVIHRDVAPANIIITRDRIAKLTDFGLARSSTDKRLSNAGAPLGSPWYMSPEQVRSVESVDSRTDIYSTGAVLYEMITGTKPFQGDSTFAVMQAHVETAPAPPSTHNPAVPPDLDTIVLQALAKDPAARFQSADAFRAALEHVQRACKAPVAPPVAAAPRNRLNPILAAMIVFPVMFAAGFGAVALTRGPRKKPAPPVVSVLPPIPAVPAQAPAAASAPVSEPDIVPGVPTEPPAPSKAIRIARRPARPAAAPAPTHSIRISGGEVQSAVAPPVSVAPAPAPTPVVSLPEPPPIPQAEPTVAPPKEPLPGAAETPPAPAKPGNRFVRALGKINPFRKKNQE
jgi:serine/threonine-protein kinase